VSVVVGEEGLQVPKSIWIFCLLLVWLSGILGLSVITTVPYLKNHASAEHPRLVKSSA
jgi:hypothetical protein